MTEHLKEMTETFDALAVMGAAVEEDDRVGFLLASLPDSYDTLVTALQGQSEEAPKWDIVTERLLQEEQKLKDRGTCSDDKKALYVQPHSDYSPRRPPSTGDHSSSSKPHDIGHTHSQRRTRTLTCHYCHKPGHFRRDCRKLARE